jgi:murein DD-endopeptidase MepM/ murein hydrolase activator NlpD
MKTEIEYQTPIDKDKIIRVSTKESRAHRIYPHSIDYISFEDAEIKAAADGIIIDVKDDSNMGGASRKYEKYENFVEIRHGGEYSYYGHIKKGSALVKIGDKVKAGQVIAKVGKTGWMANIKEPHLHFMVGRYDYKTLEIRMKN